MNLAKPHIMVAYMRMSFLPAAVEKVPLETGRMPVADGTNPANQICYR